MAEQLRVFVSHSHKDDKFCHQIVQALRDAGADVWYDEHNLGWGQLKDEIVRELGIRPVFVLILSKAVFASKWVKRETDWAEELTDRDPSRVILPVTAGQIERDDFGTENGWLFLHGYKRIEAPGYKPYPVADAANRLLRALGLTPVGEAPTPVAPQHTESVDDLLTRGKALIAQEQFAEALPLFERALALDDKQVSVLNNMSATLNALGRHEDALAAYDRALVFDPNVAFTWSHKSATLAILGRWQEALSAVDRALVLDPNDAATVWKIKAFILSEMGRSAEAEVAEKRARELGWTG